MTENRCERCNRKLMDPNARYGWRCAEILGVDKSLNYAGDGAFEAYLAGIREADGYMAEYGIDPGSIDLPAFYEAMAKRSLAASMEDFKLRRAAANEFYAALGLAAYGDKGAKTYALADYIEAKDRFDRERGAFITTGYLPDEFHPIVADIQNSLNQLGIRDKFGNPLLIDGRLGPKTQWAADQFLQGEQADFWGKDILSAAKRAYDDAGRAVDGMQKEAEDMVYKAFEMADNLKLFAEDWWLFDPDKNYENNKAIAFENRTKLIKDKNGYPILLRATDSEGYIVDQNVLGDIRFGVRGSDYNGCGWVAAYNALKLLGETPDAANLIRDMEKGLLLRGHWGTWPWFISDYFESLGYEVQENYSPKSFNNQAAEADVNIYFTLGFNGGHYVAFASAMDTGEEENMGAERYRFYNTGTQKGRWIPNPAWKRRDKAEEEQLWDPDGLSDIRTLREVMEANDKPVKILISIKKIE